MKRFGMRKAARYGGSVGVLVAVAIAVAIAAATAEATPNKPYTANVHQTLNTANSFDLTLSNDPKASQSLGSANFTPPAGLTVTGVTTPTPKAGWSVSVDTAGVVEFRSSSSSTALGAGGTVTATVTVSKTTACTATAGSATWHVDARQSNDFSGAPGNFMQFDATHSDMTPLGSYTFGPVESIQTAPDTTLIHVPQILVNQATSFNITALDTCGNVDADYTGGAFVLGTGLADATFSALNWSGGSVTASVTPKTVEVGDVFSIKDGLTGISANSVSTDGKPTFDVVQTICAGGGVSCEWKDPSGNGMKANSTVNGDNNGHASLGLGFKPFKNSDACTVGAPIGDSIYIDPYQYTQPYTIVITYPKSLAPKGPASNTVTCKDVGVDQSGNTIWSRTAIPPCGNTPAAPCADAENIQGGALQVTLYLRPGDPHTGGFTP